MLSFNRALVIKYRVWFAFLFVQTVQGLARLSHGMEIIGTRTCSDCGSIVITVVPSVKHIILRSKQTDVCLQVHRFS